MSSPAFLGAIKERDQLRDEMMILAAHKKGLPALVWMCEHVAPSSKVLLTAAKFLPSEQFKRVLGKHTCKEGQTTGKLIIEGMHQHPNGIDAYMENLRLLCGAGLDLSGELGDYLVISLAQTGSRKKWEKISAVQPCLVSQLVDLGVNLDKPLYNRWDIAHPLFRALDAKNIDCANRIVLCMKWPLPASRILDLFQVGYSTDAGNSRESRERFMETLIDACPMGALAQLGEKMEKCGQGGNQLKARWQNRIINAKTAGTSSLPGRRRL